MWTRRMRLLVMRTWSDEDALNREPDWEAQLKQGKQTGCD